jgi:single-strand DNA-binding protein
MNKAMLIGRLTRDPEVRYSQSAEPIAICKYTLAVNRRLKRDGEANADFINCVVFGKQGEFAEKYFKKGMQIAVTGRIQVNSYDDKEGQKRWSTDIVVEDQEFTESKASFENRGTATENYSNSQPSNNTTSKTSEGFSAISESIDDDDLPF